MKAISVSSGYAMLILDGTKTIECRTWQTKYRGELLICSNKDRIPDSIPGHALCVVELVNVRPFKKTDLQAAFLPPAAFDKNSFAWELKYKCCCLPFAVRGKPGLFDVDDALINRVDLDSLPQDEADRILDEYFIPLQVGAKPLD